MFCNECGTAVTADSKYCKACGAIIRHDEPATLAFDAQETDAIDDPVQKDRLIKLLEMAFWHNDVGNVDLAIKACEAALRINPASATAHSLLSTLFEKKGDDERAIEHLEAVVNLNPGSTADVTKLERLRNGIHVKAVEPTNRFYRWIPPAMAGIMTPRVGSVSSRRSSSTERPSQVMPIVYGSLAIFAVIVGGYLALRPTAPPQHARDATVTDVTDNPTNATAPQTAPTATQPGAPPRAGTNPPAAGANSIATGPDPFAPSPDALVRGSKPGTPGTNPYVALPTVRRPEPEPGLKPLPPANLSLTAQPPGGLAPAPVQVANGATLPLQVDPSHEHVVPVQLGNAPASDAPATDDGSTPSTIRITVHDAPSPSSGGSAGVQTASVSSPAPSTDRASGLEASALSMQQDGDYSGAAATYQQAIRAFKAQIATGQNVDGAQQGLKACQTGLEICQQSQQ